MKTAQYAFCQNGEINLSDDELDETETIPAGTDFDVSPSEIQIQTSSSFTSGPLRQISVNPVLDGRNLAARCLALMQPTSSSLHFVPHFFILIASTAYLEIPLLPDLRRGIEYELSDRGHQNIPLIVSSYWEGAFQAGLAVEGVILICIATGTDDAGEATVAASPEHQNLSRASLTLGLPS
jgi:hypothetical protein